jgi:hypothetical protein
MLLLIGGDDQFGLGDLRPEAIDLGSGFGKHLGAVGVAGFDLVEQGAVLRDLLAMPRDLGILGH